MKKEANDQRSNNATILGMAHLAYVSHDAMVDELTIISKRDTEFAEYVESLDACEIQPWMVEKQLEINGRMRAGIDLMLSNCPNNELRKEWAELRINSIQNSEYYVELLEIMREEES